MSSTDIRTAFERDGVFGPLDVLTRYYAKNALLQVQEELNDNSSSKFKLHLIIPAISKISHPVDVGYARGGMGATLTVLTSGAQAPMLEMQKEQMRTKVNACYGYNAIARIRITQTAATGFSEGRMVFDHGTVAPPGPKPEAQSTAQDLAAPVKSDTLRAALEALGANVISKRPSGS